LHCWELRVGGGIGASRKKRKLKNAVGGTWCEEGLRDSEIGGESRVQEYLGGSRSDLTWQKKFTEKKNSVGQRGGSRKAQTKNSKSKKKKGRKSD